jgi:hypothetical protein
MVRGGGCREVNTERGNEYISLATYNASLFKKFQKIEYFIILLTFGVV